MPARTNEFQKLIKIINQSLIPAGAKITESAMLYDPISEKEREVDILIESTILNCNIRIGVECTEISRPLDVGKLESFKEKHKNVGINKTIVVAKNGFTTSSKKFAEKNDIKLLTFNHAKKENWLKKFERFQGLSIYARNYFLSNVQIKFRKSSADMFNVNSKILVESNGQWISLSDFVKDTFISSNISKIAGKELIENEMNGKEPWIKIGFSLNEAFPFKDEYGVIVKPFEIEVVMNYKSNYKQLNPKQVEYDGESVVAGVNYDNKTKDFVSVSITESSEGYKAEIEMNESIFPER